MNALLVGGGKMNAYFVGVLVQGFAMGMTNSVTAEVQEFDTQWAQRDDDEAAVKLERQAQAFAASAYYEELWRAASWYVWVASGDLPSDQVRAAALAGRRAGERALELNGQGVEAKYWTALAVGLYASSVSPFEAMTLGIDKRFRLPLQEVMDADPGCDNPHIECVGAQVALASLYSHLPWPSQDRKKARGLFERAVNAHPENLRARYLLGEFLKDEDKPAARRELEQVRDGDEAYDPPDARRQKDKASQLLDQLR